MESKKCFIESMKSNLLQHFVILWYIKGIIMIVEIFLLILYS